MSVELPADLEAQRIVRELHAMQPRIDELRMMRETITALADAGITQRVVDGLLAASERQTKILERLEHIEPKLDRIDQLIGLLDQLELLARRQ